MRFAILILLGMFVSCAFADAAKAAPENALALKNAATAAAKKYQVLLAEYEEDGGARLFARRFLELAHEYPKDPVALDALFWVVENVRGRADTEKALAQIRKLYLENGRLGPGCKLIARSRSLSAEQVLRDIMDKNKRSQVQALAGYYLAELLTTEAAIIKEVRKSPKLAPRVMQYYGDAYGKHLAALKPDEHEKRREKVYERLLKSHADVKVGEDRIGDVATEALFAIRHLAVGKQAPEIQGKDILGAVFKLSDYRGKVVMLSFWGHW